MKHTLALVLMVFGLVGCASTSFIQTEPFEYQKDPDGMKGFHYYGYGPTGTRNLESFDKFKNCMGLGLYTPLYAIHSFGTSKDMWCFGVSFSDFGIFINNKSPRRDGSIPETSRAFVSYKDLLSPLTSFRTIKSHVLEININGGNEKFFIITDSDYSFEGPGLLTKFENGKEEFKYNPRDYEESKQFNSMKPMALSKDFFNLIEESGLTILSIAPNIPSRKEKSFRECNSIPDSEKILAYFDFTFFVRTGCEGVAFTNKGFYVKPGKWAAMDCHSKISGGRGRYYYSYQEYMLLEFKTRRCGEVEIAPGAYVDTRLEKLFAVLKNGVSTMTDEEILIAAKPRPNQTNLEAAEQILSIILPVYLFSQSVSSCSLPNKPGSPSAAAPRRVKASYSSRAKKYNKALASCKKNKTISSALLWFWEDIDEAVFE
jgi:hypothetical protein